MLRCLLLLKYFNAVILKALAFCKHVIIIQHLEERERTVLIIIMVMIIIIIMYLKKRKDVLVDCLLNFSA